MSAIPNMRIESILAWLRLHTAQPQTLPLTLVLNCVCLTAATIILMKLSIRIKNTPQYRHCHNGSSSSKSDPAQEVPSVVNPNKDRAFGEWTPVPFTYPEISACPRELSEMKPIPYRPFRWGAYNITMGIRSMSWTDWIELDDGFETYHRIRANRIRTRGSKVIRVLPDNPGLVRSGGEAAIELVHEVAEYLSRRYPTTFHIVRHVRNSAKPHPFMGWEGATPIKSVTIVPVCESYELPLSVADGGAEKAMEISALLVQDDLALMIEGLDGRYYFQAGAVCVAGFWRMSDKIGLPLDEIHTSGHVPQYQEKLRASLERFFRRLPVNKPVIRNNYFVQMVRPEDSREGSEHGEIDPEELAWSETTNGPEDEFKHGYPGNPAVEPTPRPETLRLRTERQTLRRLPKSGAVVFTIRTYIVPVERLGREKGVPGRMASAVRSWPEDVGVYKGSRLYKEELCRYMDACHARQVESGEVEEGQRDGAYPY